MADMKKDGAVAENMRKSNKSRKTMVMHLHIIALRGGGEYQFVEFVKFTPAASFSALHITFRGIMFILKKKKPTV